jgi:hypothetical protein
MAENDFYYITVYTADNQVIIVRTIKEEAHQQYGSSHPDIYLRTTDYI